MPYRLSYLLMTARDNFSPGKNYKWLMLALALLALAAIAALLAIRQGAGEKSAVSSEPAATTAAPARTLAETDQAGFISIFVYNAAGEVASYMVGSGTDEFNQFVEAIEKAQPVAAAADETFSDMLIISFGHNDTIDLSYSPEKNTLIREEQAYLPPTDLKPLIASVERKFDF